MKQHLECLIQAALSQLQASGDLPETATAIHLEPTKETQFGDFACNIAMVLAKAARKKPREIAERLVKALPASPHVQKVEIAGPGFINFYLTPQALTDIVKTILSEKALFGSCERGQSQRVLIEFLSSNPTGPLHVGHGRHAAVGSIISNLLSTIGFNVYREYYVNDAGRQMDILAVSVWIRYLCLAGEALALPANAYQGAYVQTIAQALKDQYGAAFVVPVDQICKGLPNDESAGGEKEAYIDAIIARAKDLLGEHYEVIFTKGLTSILSDIEADLAQFGVVFDNWFSERAFVSTKVVDTLLQTLRDSGHVYEREKALWFRSTDYGDTKDRVLVRSNGQRTYFANDVAYHLRKFERGFDLAIDIFGSDHHGYVPRMKAAMQASGINTERLMHLLVQFVTLYRGQEQVAMSTRAGEFVTLRELRQEVGNDAARFFYVMRKFDQHIDFDLELAKAASNENPVYYVQYAHARIASVFRQLAERGVAYDEAKGLTHLATLTQEAERQILNTLSRYPDMILSAALQYEPHLLTNYLRELATEFHSYYNSHQFLVEDAALRNARLSLIAAVKQVLSNGFQLLGITAPESM